MIEKNFSKYAHLYDRYADIQYDMAGKLIKEAPLSGIQNILELGCGTGNYTYLLRKKFSAARIKAVDISESMIEAARKKMGLGEVEFIAADAEEFSFNSEFNLITSNAAFQWFNKTEKTLIKYKDSLRTGGIILFSSFGPLTFFELAQSLKKAIAESVAISSENFLSREELSAVFKKHFAGNAIKEFIIKKEYSSLIELLKRIKYTGARGNGIDNFSLLWKKGMMGEIEKAYKTGYGRIDATYQVFLCRAVK